MKEQEQKKPHQWFKLDNAGKIFPGQNTSKWSNIFRISVTLTEDIDSHLLEKALKITLVRFPCFDVRIRRGFFWYYLEKNKYEAPPVMEDIQNPCQRVRWNENLGFLFRVYYYKTRLSVEFFHALTDAYGASRFLMTLTACYLRLTGKDIPAGYSVLDINEQASSEELEDAFLKVTPSKVKKNRRKKFVYHVRGTKMPAHMVNLTTGYMPVEVL
ncbi:MAG: alcohol acetyltransferase, partial [Clostridia bacterium]|nr:alcohol acetyltransferase [Clostridia bacterium]